MTCYTERPENKVIFGKRHQGGECSFWREVKDPIIGYSFHQVLFSNVFCSPEMWPFVHIVAKKVFLHSHKQSFRKKSKEEGICLE